MKKEKYILTFLVILLSIYITTAQNQFTSDVGGFIEKTIIALITIVSSIFAPIFGVSTSVDFMFAKILFFILLFSISVFALKKIDAFKKNTSVVITVSLIFSILAVRYLKEDSLIRGILLPYASGGAAIATLIPLIIFFYFVHASGVGPFGRKFAWFTYGAFFIFLWGSREFAVSALGKTNYIYGLGLGFIIISFIFDGHLHEYFQLGKYNKAKSLMLKGKYVDYLDKAEKAHNAGEDGMAEDFRQKARDIARRM